MRLHPHSPLIPTPLVQGSWIRRKNLEINECFIEIIYLNLIGKYYLLLFDQCIIINDQYFLFVSILIVLNSAKILLISMKLFFSHYKNDSIDDKMKVPWIEIR